jgi:hypothetical protein
MAYDFDIENISTPTSLALGVARKLLGSRPPGGAGSGLAIVAAGSRIQA